MAARSASPPLTRDSSSRFLPWIIALMVFLAAFALAAAMLLADAIERWDRGLSGSLTVQVPPAQTDQETRKRVDRVVEILRATPGIEAAEPLSREQLGDLLTPWLGSGAAAEDLPLPRLIDVKRRPDAALDAEELTERIAQAAPGVVVDDHQDWLNRLVRYARALEATASATVVIIAAVAVATVVFATLTRMSIHREVIDLLHLMGATNAYVARQFERHALLLGCGGGIIGLLAASLALLALDRAAAGLGNMLLPAPKLLPWQWAVLAALPAATGLIAMVTARITVIARLRQVP